MMPLVGLKEREYFNNVLIEHRKGKSAPVEAIQRSIGVGRFIENNGWHHEQGDVNFTVPLPLTPTNANEEPRAREMQ